MNVKGKISVEKLNRDYAYQKLLDDPEDPYSEEKDSSSGFSIQNKFQWHVWRIPFRHFIRVVIALPLGAFAFGVFWALYYEYTKSTNVLCARDHNRPVRNYLPSLSAAIGDFETSQFVWKLCIIVHSPGRFLFASMYFKYLKKVLQPQYTNWAGIACSLHIIENIGLLGLTLITSKRNLPLHATNFAIFIVASELYMITLCVLLSKCKSRDLTRLEQKSLSVKKILCNTAIICSFLLFLVYFRHETKCEEGVYTIFALLEYIVVLANIGFHGSAYWDFLDRIIVVDFYELCKVPVYKNSWEY